MRKMDCGKIGMVKVTRRKGAKSIRVRVNALAEVCMSIPYYVSYTYAKQFLSYHEDKIVNLKNKSLQKQHGNRFVLDKAYPLANGSICITQGTTNQFYFTENNNQHLLHLPVACSLQDQNWQQAIEQVMVNKVRELAKAYLPPLVNQLAAEKGYCINKVYIKNQKTRWGSCSSKGNINLNLHLMRLPQQYIHYVIIHELTHIHEPNHGPGFWKLLEHHLPGARLLDKQLNKYSPQEW